MSMPFWAASFRASGDDLARPPGSGAAAGALSAGRLPGAGAARTRGGRRGARCAAGAAEALLATLDARRSASIAEMSSPGFPTMAIASPTLAWPPSGSRIFRSVPSEEDS